MMVQQVQYVIKSMSQAGDIVVMDLRTLITKTLPAQFGRPHVPVTIEELHVFCCMLGNDYIPTGNKGEGLVKCANKFKEYLSDDTEDGRKMWLSDYTKEHDSPEKIEMALFAWQHGPAFIIVPKNSNIHPKEAFISGEYIIELGSMSILPATCSTDFYQPEPKNPKLGYIPHQQIRSGHIHSDQDSHPSYRDFFLMDSYVRTGKLLESVPIQCNKAGQEVTPGVIVHFHNQPIKFLLDRVLELWLSCRGICISDLTRNDMEKMVALLLRHEVDALPKFVLRGGGAYVAVSTLEFDNEESVDWRKKEDALAEIRSDKCACVDDE